MTEKKRLKAITKLRPYVRELADLMKLRDWEITLKDKLAEGGSNATCSLTWGRNSAHIFLGKSFFSNSPECQRQTICHELVHCLFAPMHNGLCEALDGPTQKMYLEVFERSIDAMADIIAPSMPLPPQL